jgi:hypothetical protein
MDIEKLITGVAQYDTNRPIVSFDVNGVPMMFYRSSKGTSGKIQGEWHPLLGVGENEWFIKAGKINESGRIRTGLPEIDDIADALNKRFPRTMSVEQVISELTPTAAKTKSIMGTLPGSQGIQGAGSLNRKLYGVNRFPISAKSESYLVRRKDLFDQIIRNRTPEATASISEGASAVNPTPIEWFEASMSPEERKIWSRQTKQAKKQIAANLKEAELAGGRAAAMEGLRKEMAERARIESLLKDAGMPTEAVAKHKAEMGFLDDLAREGHIDLPGSAAPSSPLPKPGSSPQPTGWPSGGSAVEDLLEGSPKAGGAGGGGGVPPTPPTSDAGAAAEGASEAGKAGEALAEAAGLAKAGKAATVAEKAAEAASFWSKTGNLLGKGLHIGGALMTPLMLLDIGLRIAEESGADVYGKKARERKIFGEDVASAMDRKSLENLDRFNETSTIPQITQMVRGITPMGQALGISQANADQSFGNYMNNKQMRLSQLSQPMGQQPSIEEMALRLGLPT